MWRSLEGSNPPELDAEMYGWVKDSKLKTLQPVLLPANVELAPETVMRMIRCGWKSDTPAERLLAAAQGLVLNVQYSVGVMQQVAARILLSILIQLDNVIYL